MNKSLEEHWQEVYHKKNENEVSWFQKSPKLSLDFICSLNLNLDSHIIDIGAGESRLVDNLLNLGYTNISVLDISLKSIEKTKKRLGLKSKLVNWIVSDINQKTIMNANKNTWKDLLNSIMSIEYNDFGFTAIDADELASIDTKIVEKTVASATAIAKMDDFIRPLLENLMKDSDKDYIYWPNRVEILRKKLDELDDIQKNS